MPEVGGRNSGRFFYSNFINENNVVFGMRGLFLLHKLKDNNELKIMNLS